MSLTKWLCILLLLVFAGCGSGNKEINRIMESPISYNSHLSPSVDLSQYRTWDWLSPLVDETSVDRQALEPEMRQAIETTVGERMKDRGYSRTIVSPDLVINYHVAGADIDEDYIKKMYDGKYYPKYRTDFSGPRSAKKKWQEGSILVFIFDPVSGELVWRASAIAEVTGDAPIDRRIERLNQALKMVFTSLPGKPPSEMR
jgi:hypothetical protein